MSIYRFIWGLGWGWGALDTTDSKLVQGLRGEYADPSISPRPSSTAVATQRSREPSPCMPRSLFLPVKSQVNWRRDDSQTDGPFWPTEEGLREDVWPLSPWTVPSADQQEVVWEPRKGSQNTVPALFLSISHNQILHSNVLAAAWPQIDRELQSELGDRSAVLYSISCLYHSSTGSRPLTRGI